MKLLIKVLLFSQCLFFCYQSLLFGQGHMNSAIYGKKNSSEKFEKISDSGFDMVEFFPEENKEYIEYVIGQGIQNYTANRYLYSFAMNRYETTYELWYETLYWAKSHGYSFASEGQAGSEGKRAKAPLEDDKMQPVTCISWYDAIVWCNALSEKNGLKPCYTYKNKVLRDSNDSAYCDLAFCDWTSNGFRLPSEAEWEYAARKCKEGMQSGSLASGENSKKTLNSVAWTCSNTKSTRNVASLGNANGSGLFDMSGNVLEFCWDWFADYGQGIKGRRAVGPKFGSERVSRGGSWSEYTPVYGAGDRYSYDPNEAYNYMGFRFARSISQ